MCGTVTDQPPPAPEHVDDPWDGVDIDHAVASFFRALADGPLRDDALLAALRDDGAWGALGELADDDFAAEISDLDVPGLWRTQMAMWFDVFRTLDGRVFTHRLTADELAEGAVAALPDLTLVDWDVPARRIVGGSGAVADFSALPPRPRRERDGEDRRPWLRRREAASASSAARSPKAVVPSRKKRRVRSIAFPCDPDARWRRTEALCVDMTARSLRSILCCGHDGSGEPRLNAAVRRHPACAGYPNVRNDFGIGPP